MSEQPLHKGSQVHDIQVGGCTYGVNTAGQDGTPTLLVQVGPDLLHVRKSHAFVKARCTSAKDGVGNIIRNVDIYAAGDEWEPHYPCYRSGCVYFSGCKS